MNRNQIDISVLVGAGLLGAGITGYVLGGVYGLIGALSLTALLYAIAAGVLKSI